MGAQDLLQPVTLRGRLVRLEPLTAAHVRALAAVGTAPELWRWQPEPVLSEADMIRYVARAVEDQARGVSLPFVVVLAEGERIVGSTRYMDWAPAHRRVEIGATWLAPAMQRSGVNTEVKHLLLRHAFEVLGVQRVVFKTEVLNEQSRRAILRLGAVEEGTFRKHLIAASGRARDMVYFSILDSEWPAVDARLSGLASRSRSG